MSRLGVNIKTWAEKIAPKIVSQYFNIRPHLDLILIFYKYMYIYITITGIPILIYFHEELS